MAADPGKIRAMVKEGKSNLSIALSLGVSIKEVILTVQGMEDERDAREKLRVPFDYVPNGLPNRKSKPWTTGERKAILTSEASLGRMAESLGRTYGSVNTQRSVLRKSSSG